MKLNNCNAIYNPCIRNKSSLGYSRNSMANDGNPIEIVARASKRPTTTFQQKHMDENESYSEGRRTEERMSSYLASNPQLGSMLLGGGFMLTFLGMMLFFERNLLRLGNILIVAGITLLVGPSRVQTFFFQRHRLQATIITFLGVLLVLSGRPRIGIVCEIFGLLNLFGNMLPLLLAIPKRLPILGDLLNVVFDSAQTGNSKKTKYFPEF